MRGRLSALVVAVVAVLLAPAVPSAHAAPSAGAARLAHAGSPNSTKAPSGPPITGEGSSGRSGFASSGPSVSGESAAPPSGGDALVENGLGSPMCRNAKSELSAEAQRSCELSDFVAAPDPTGNFALDVNINTGLGDVGNYMAVIIQDFAGFGWTLFVAITHGMLVMFEWCYSLNVLTGEGLIEVENGLHGAGLSFTEPWMVFALCVASVFVVYNGLVRRRVAETLGKTLAMLVMMVVGLSLIVDPGGTIVPLDHLVDEAGIGTLATVASGSPKEPKRTLTGDMRELFSATVGAPWCYLEFGTIDWCEGALDSKLRKSALKIAAKEQAESGCPGLCGRNAGPKAKTLAVSAALLREAHSNGELFLALPANGTARNSTKEEWSLLSVLCGGKEQPADECKGPTAAQAEFRSEKGTYPRLEGVFLIWLGGLGMLLLFGFLALHLLSAAVRTLVFLLFAPAAVLAPAFGDSGRALFRTWLLRLLAAVVSKLVFSFLLGVMLMMTDVLLRLRELKWTAQWFFISGFWWVVFFKRHQVIGLLKATAQGGQATPQRSLASRVRNALETPRAMLKTALWAGGKVRTAAPDVQKRRRLSKAAHEVARQRADEQVTRTLDHDHSEATQRVDSASEIQSRISGHREKLERLRLERQRAIEKGDKRRAAKLGVRAQKVESEIARDQKALTDARRSVSDGEAAERLSGTPYTREQREERSRFLDAQTALPAAGRRNAEGIAREYGALAGLVGHTAQAYEQMSPREQRKARLKIDRELAARSQLHAAAAEFARSNEPAPSRKERRTADKAIDRVVSQRVRDEGRTPASEAKRETAIDRYLAGSARSSAESSNGRPTAGAARQSPHERSDGQEPVSSRSPSTVMDDAQRVARRRKRQLGRGPRR